MAEATAQAEWTTEDSPKRAHAKALCIQGVPRATICAQLGVPKLTYDSWAKRGGWIALREAIAPQVQSRATIAITTHNKSFSLRPKLHAKAEKLIESLPDKCPKDMRGAKDVMAALAHATSASASIEGWSDTSIAVLDLEQLGRDHREIVVTPVTPATSGEQLPSEYQQTPESLGNSG